MQENFASLARLESLRNGDLTLLEELDIRNLGDLLAYEPIRHARYVRAAADQLVPFEDVAPYLIAEARDLSASEVLVSGVDLIMGVGAGASAVLSQLGLATIADLAAYAPFDEAENQISAAIDDATDPSAPSCVLPTCRKFTKNRKSYVSFFAQTDLRNLSVESRGNSKIASLFNFGLTETGVVRLGYSVSYLQDWIYGGVHLGEPQGSVNLFMGQDSQVSVLDWRRAVRAARNEDTTVDERLASTLFHQRAVDEVARATAEEHQFGGTSSFGANAATSGSLVAAGAIVGSVGGGVVGGLAGLSLDALALGTTAGLGTISGSVVGAAVGGIAGSAAGSLVMSGATALGVVDTDATGTRDIFARSAQNIQQNTVQNSSSIRSFWSNIVSQSAEEEQQEIRTDRVTNHNRIHALNALYFEVLNEYTVNIRARDFDPLLFVPFKPLHFTENVVGRYWWILRESITDKALIQLLDQHFLTVGGGPDLEDQLEALPEVADVETANIRVELNLDESWIESLFPESIVDFVIGGFAEILIEAIFGLISRGAMRVELVTTDGVVPLRKVQSPNLSPSFIGAFETSRRIAVHTIQGVRINNGSFEIDLPGIDPLGELQFEEISAELTLANPASIRPHIASIRSLEPRTVISSQPLNVPAARSGTVAWDIADRLRDLFEGVQGERDELTQRLEDQEDVDARLTHLLGFLNANKFSFTRLILGASEREQLIRTLEEVRIGGLHLTDIASVDPVGIAGNHVLLPLKVPAVDAAVGKPDVRVDTDKIDFELDMYEAGARQKAGAARARDRLAQITATKLVELGALADPTPTEQRLTRQLEHLGEAIDEAKFEVAKLDIDSDPDDGAVPEPVLQLLRRQLETSVDPGVDEMVANMARDVQETIRRGRRSDPAEIAQLLHHFGSVVASLEPEVDKLLSSEAVSLPSPAVFMEPVLSNAKGAELYDMRRNSHWEVLPAPAIGTTDPNVVRARNIELEPTVIAPGLTIQNAPEFPLPNNLAAALGEAGRLDLGPLISSNANTLDNTLSGLASVASELAKTSAGLTGDAQQQALDAATQVAGQVSGIVADSLQLPPPPVTQQQKAEVERRIDEIDKESKQPNKKPNKPQRKRAIGAPPGPVQRQYSFEIFFLDEGGVSYPDGTFTLELGFPGQTVALNAGEALAIDPAGRGQLERDAFTLETGTRISATADATINGRSIRGTTNFTLGSRDPILECTLKAETIPVKKKDGKTAIRTVIDESSFSADLNAKLEQFVRAGVKFPFKIFKVDAEAGTKTLLDFKAEYEGNSADNTVTTTDENVEFEFEVVIPGNTWIINVR